MNGPKYVRSEQHGNVLIITPLFTFATFTEPHVASEWAAVQEQLDSPATEHVIVDLGEIPYFGSTVLEWMAKVVHTCQKHGVPVVVRTGKPCASASATTVPKFSE